MARAFLSYRRDDAPGSAGRLADQLTSRLGPGAVFIDVERIKPGVDFIDEVTRAVDGCEVLLVLIGPRWIDAADRSGRLRLHEPDDLVALEIRLALLRRIRTVPVLVEGAEMPDADALPEQLRPLSRLNALRLNHGSFHADVARLIAATPASSASSTTSPFPPRGSSPIRRGNTDYYPVGTRPEDSARLRQLDEASPATDAVPVELRPRPPLGTRPKS